MFELTVWVEIHQLVQVELEVLVRLGKLGVALADVHIPDDLSVSELLLERLTLDLLVVQHLVRGVRQSKVQRGNAAACVRWTRG